MFIHINSKGGSGKSTTASQVTAAYIYDRQKVKADLVEIDDENQDSATFHKSEIMNIELIITHDIDSLENLLLDNEPNAIIDVGGNKTATFFLEEVEKLGLGDEKIWMIAIDDGELSAQNAIDTYAHIKRIDEEATIIFVLGRSFSLNKLFIQDQFINFFGNRYLDNANEHSILAKIPDAQYIVIKNSLAIKLSRYLNKTAYELAKSDTNFKDKARQAKRDGDEAMKKKYLYFNRVKRYAVEFVKEMLEPTFDKLDAILEVKKD